ncbi:MAG: carboxylesterase family protein [Bacteroidales bacterium]|nr:carboxylesterase family protein [Bacteroidales bacterium]
MKMKRSLILLMLLFLTFGGYSRQDNDTIILKETFLYAIKDTDTLYLDKYELKTSSNEQKPCMIFVFGGGFYAGSRDEESYIDYYNFLALNGYTVVAIDYRLGFKKAEDIKDNKKVTFKKFLKYFEYTIDIAVEDLYDATDFILKHSEEWGIDKNMISATGSSAGGITVLHAAYEISNGGELAKRLPENFNYAGIISCAGAIFSMDGKLKWKDMPAPIQMFHGDADKNVPYNKLKFFRYGLYGSENLAKQLRKREANYYFYSERNVDHYLAVAPLYNNREEIMSFLDRYVTKKMKLQTEIEVVPMEISKIKNNYKPKDYIKQNLNP